MNNNKNILLWCTVFALFALVSCKPVDDSLEEWRLENEAAYNAIKDDPEWTLLDTGDGPSGIYFRDLTEPETVIGDEYPLETSSVTVNYTGKFHNGQIFDKGSKNTFAVNGTVRGFGAALQQMRVGQKWEICIPYYLGYGVIGKGSIQPYTTLFFEIELLQINRYP